MFLKQLESWLERGQIVPFLREKRPRKKFTPNIGADISAITGILLTKISSPPNRNETAMAVPSPRVLETDTSAPRG
jgi:hypothetical protein